MRQMECMFWKKPSQETLKLIKFTKELAEELGISETDCAVQVGQVMLEIAKEEEEKVKTTRKQCIE